MAYENKEIEKRAQIRKKVKKLLAEIARVNDDKIKENAKIRDDLGVDSVSSMEILAAIETRLGIVIDEARAFNIVTVKDLIELVMFYLEDNTFNGK